MAEMLLLLEAVRATQAVLRPVNSND